MANPASKMETEDLNSSYRSNYKEDILLLLHFLQE